MSHIRAILRVRLGVEPRRVVTGRVIRYPGVMFGLGDPRKTMRCRRIVGSWLVSALLVSCLVSAPLVSCLVGAPLVGNP